MSTNPLDRLGSQRTMDSFMGVSFGDSVDQVERRFPTGLRQTSPYGARAFKLEDVTSDNIEYQQVVYEFTEPGGMQMVIAQFAPSAGADVYHQLESNLGAPAASEAASQGPAGAEASWKLADGTQVRFSGPYHRMVLLSKDGASLETDIHLRDQYISPIS